MSDLRNHQSLSYGDAIFYYLEREGSPPLTVASVCTFEGEIALSDCIRYIESKIPLIPRYRQRVVTAPFNFGLPLWEFDPDFDVSNHIHEVTLKRGTEAELKDLAGKLFTTRLDLSRPLWHFTLVHGLKGQRTGLIIRVHHSLADGISGVGMLNAIMDSSPIRPKLPKRKPRFASPPPRDVATLLADGFVHTCFSMTDRVLTIQSKLLNIAENLMAVIGKPPEPTEASAVKVQNGTNGIDSQRMPAGFELTKLGAELIAPVERMPFNVVTRGLEKFNWTSLSLAEIKAVKQAAGATVNDVLLAIITRTLQHYSELHGVRNRLVKIIVPVNLRGKDDVGELGNRITFLPLAVPLSIHDPKELVAAVSERMQFLKGARMGEVVGLAGVLIETIPTPLQAVLLPVINELPISLCNTICTNVPGPQYPLYFFGHKMLSAYPHVPIGSEMGMNSAILTYDGVAHFGFTGDAKAIPDLELLEKLVNTSFAEILAAFGIHPQRRMRAPSPRPKATVKTKAAANKKTTTKTKAKAAAASTPAPVAATPNAASAASAETVPKQATPAEAKVFTAGSVGD